MFSAPLHCLRNQQRQSDFKTEPSVADMRGGGLKQTSPCSSQTVLPTSESRFMDILDQEIHASIINAYLRY